MKNDTTLASQPLTPAVQHTNSLHSSDKNLNTPNNRDKWIKISIVIIIILLLGGTRVLTYQYFNKQKTSENSRREIGVQPPQSPGDMDQSSLSVMRGENIDWLPYPKKVPSVGFFGIIDQHCPFQLRYYKPGDGATLSGVVEAKYEPKASYYEVGTVNSGQYRGGTVYLGIVRGLPNSHVVKGVPTEKDIVNDLNQSYIFIKMPDNTFIVTKDYDNATLLNQSIDCVSNKTFPTETENKTRIKIDEELSIDKIGSNFTYTDSVSGIKFAITRTSNFFNQSSLYLVKDLGNNTALYSNQNFRSNSIKLKTVINPVFIIKLPTGLVAEVQSSSYSDALVYQKGTAPNSYYPYSLNNQINWTAQDKPKQLPKEPTDKGIMNDYTGVTYTSDYDGCRGNITLENSSSEAEYLDTQNNLEQVGTTDKGDTIYDFKNKDFRIFQQFWLWKVISNGLESLSYNDYLELKPILIQKDKLGVYHMIFRAELVASKCWSEPLIYLYPEKQTEVKIQLSKVINLSESEPPYSNGWNVIAYPNGKIYDTSKQRYYPYLYWEGSAPVSSKPVFTDVVANKDVHKYFNDKLSKLGLNSKEITDFESYWEPKLKDSPYYLISFYDASELNKIAPLSIQPPPTTLIRILMTYEELNTKISISQLNTNYSTPQRKGFTVVELGGVLHYPKK